MSPFADGQITLSRDGATAFVTLNRPDKKNAINNAMLGGLDAALRTAAQDAKVRS